jgi:hypothetical protein
MSEWRDIETAPKDGTEILVWRKGWGRHIARWVNEWGDKYFRLASGRDILGGPSHWMPLPDPPSRKEE